MFHCRVGFALFLCPLAGAQATYDAGTAGNPPQAPSPTTQGWSETITGSNSVTDVSPDPDFPLNAWQLTDHGPGAILYEALFDPGDEDYEFEVVLRPLAGKLRIGIASGWQIFDNVFDVQLELAGNDVHVLRPGDAPIVCALGADGYHRYRFLSGQGWPHAAVYYDEVFVGYYPFDSFADASPRMWVATVDGEAGRWRWNQARFGPPLPRAIGTGYCGPAVRHSGGIPARIQAFGHDRWWLNDVRLDALDLPPNRFGYFLVSATQGFVSNPGGSQGNLCLAGNIGRYASHVLNSGPGGSFSLAIDLTSLPTIPPSTVGSGETWSFQAWFRDVNPTQTSNFTDGVAVFFP